MSTQAKEVTMTIFRTVYYLAKENRPFTAHAVLVELQKLNGIDMGRTLHSRYTANEVVNRIAFKMRKSIVEDLVRSETKLAVLVDESTILSKKQPSR